MKIKASNKTNSVLALFAALSVFSAALLSCKTADTEQFVIIDEKHVPPPMPTELPVIEYSGLGIKFECEQMLLHNAVAIQDKEASGNFAIHIIDESANAKVKVKFPAGTYEVLLREKAKDADHSAFYVFVDGQSYRVYPNNPPSGSWELTTRTPVYFTIEEQRTVLFTIQSNSDSKSGHTGMSLDYIQFIKRQ